MLKKLIFLVGVFLFFLLPSSVFAAQSPDFSSDEIIVKFKDNISDEQIEKATETLGTKISKKLLLPQTFTLKVSDKQVEKFLEKVDKNSLVEYAERDFIAEALVEPRFVPNDPYFFNQWGMVKIKGPEAWDITHGSSSSKIAILDTGIDNNHEDLQSKVDTWINFTSSSTSDDLYGHGTHVAGIAAAATNNSLGVAGLGFNAHLLSVKVLNDSGSGYYSWVVDGIKWAADNGAKVINLSLGGLNRSKTLEKAVDYAWEKGVVLACAAGNSANKSPTYPAYYKNCLAVAATDENDQKASFSSFGSWVDVAAPGTNIYSTWKDNTYKSASGTSMAASLVSGLAGLIFGADPTLTNISVRGLIESNTDLIADIGTYWLKGRINAYKSIMAIPGIALPVPEPKSTSIQTNSQPTSSLIPATVSGVSSLSANQKPWWCLILSGLCQ